MTVHILKTWPAYYQAIADGTKTFEIRRNDRNYQPGDVLRLAEYDPDTGTLTGRVLERTVGFIAAGQIFDLSLGHHVVMSLLAAEDCAFCSLARPSADCVCTQRCGTSWCGATR